MYILYFIWASKYESLIKLYKGQVVKKGEIIATLGNITENGGWPPHLHFQIMRYILDWEGDFPWGWSS
jgi:murein DD-endopeptidase MepM/ murein hydrolase activator NlpD